MAFRIACLQFDSKHADVATNQETLKRLSARLESRRGQVDMLVLPEMALTGYVFENHGEIDPLLEFLPSDQSVFKPGPTLSLAISLAKQHGSYVLAGLAERGFAPNPTSDPYDARPLNSPPHQPPNGLGHAYNSAILVDRTGQLIHTFRKHFLYDDDKRWATSGPGFEFMHLPGLGRLCVAICMDLNPYNFTSPFDSFELAQFCKLHEVRALIVPMAWLRPRDEEASPSLSTINYWALRCSPLFDAGGRRYMIAANRTGTEGGSTFAGSSCAFKMRSGERPELLGALGTDEEGILLLDIPSDDAE